MTGKFLEREREALERFLPGLDGELTSRSFHDLEQNGSPIVSLFRKARGAALLVPREFGGLGATALDAVRVQRAIGSRCPSLAIVATMHGFSLATLVEFSIFGNEDGGDLLTSIVENDMLMASGFAEGKPGAYILSAAMEARKSDGGYTIRGSKKPCSLSRSMDLLSGSATLISDDGEPRRALILVPADAEGIERRPFWNTPILAAAESDEVILNDVEIPEDLLFVAESDDQMDPVEVAGYVWFQLLVSAGYLGIASGLAERVIVSERGRPVERTALGIELEGAMCALEGLARAMAEEPRESLLGRALFVRYAVQGAIERATNMATESLGGISFITSDETVTLLAASRALAFHPPSRRSSAEALAGLLVGTPLKTV